MTHHPSTINHSLKILLLSKFDYAGSGYRIAEAVNLNSTNFVMPITLYPLDFPKHLKRLPSLIKDVDGTMKGWFQDFDRLQALIDDADIIHFKGDFLPPYPKQITFPPDTPTIISVGGTFFLPEYRTHPIKDYIKATTLQTALRPDLIYPDFPAIYTPHPFDVAAYFHCWRPSDPVIIAHAPSDRKKKGTQKILDAVYTLQAEGLPVTLDIIEDVSYTECLERKKKATFFFNDVSPLFGWYSNAAIEAMALGIPTLNHLDDIAFKKACMPDCPVINTGLTPESVIAALRSAVTMPVADLRALSQKSRDFVRKYHSYQVIGELWSRIYHGLATRTP